jgi:Asp-tRNA(Asn)/Glu-tRNA(Gln) amidotransferase A subunit family amidase
MLRGIDHEIARAFEDALVTLSMKGARVIDFTLPIASRWTAIASSIVMHAEAAVIHADRFRSDAESYGEDVATRIISGQAFLGADLARANWLRAQIAAELDDAFGHLGQIDAIVAPAVPATAPVLAPGAFVPGDAPWSIEVGPFHLQRLPSLIGLPAGTVPVGWSRSSMPMPLMAMAAKWHDSTVLTVLEAVCAAIPTAPSRFPSVGEFAT